MTGRVASATSRAVGSPRRRGRVSRLRSVMFFHLHLLLISIFFLFIFFCVTYVSYTDTATASRPTRAAALIYIRLDPALPSPFRPVGIPQFDAAARISRSGVSHGKPVVAALQWGPHCLAPTYGYAWMHAVQFVTQTPSPSLFPKGLPLLPVFTKQEKKTTT